MTTLRVIAEQLVARVPGGVGRYTEELTRELIACAPAGCEVEAILAAHSQEDIDKVRAKLPGLVNVSTASLGRKELSRAWQYGVPIPLGGGMIHAPSPFAPLFKHDRLNDGKQTVVTIHDVVPWTHPETLKTHGVAWHKAMIKRARKYADGLVVPTHAVAEQLSERFDFGDRIRVIGGAVSPALVSPADAQARASALKLPSEYVLSVGTLEPRKGLTELINAMALPDAEGLPLLVVGPDGWGNVQVTTVAMEAGLPEGRVRVLGFLDDADLAVVFTRASVFVFPSFAEGFGLPVLEAMKFGTPVIHSDDPALVEVAGGAGVVVEREATGSSYAERLAHAIKSVTSDSELIERLTVHGIDRSRAFSWRDSAERVWQLHADL